jgi:hypothetical protein
MLPQIAHNNTVTLANNYELETAKDVNNLVPDIGVEAIYNIIYQFNEFSPLGPFVEMCINEHGITSREDIKNIIINVAERIQFLRLKYSTILENDQIYSHFDSAVARSLVTQILTGKSMQNLVKETPLKSVNIDDQLKENTPIIGKIIDSIKDDDEFNLEEDVLLRALHTIFGNRDEIIEETFKNVKTHINSDQQEYFRILAIQNLISRTMPSLSSLGLELSQRDLFVKKVADVFIKNYKEDDTVTTKSTDEENKIVTA